MADAVPEDDAGGEGVRLINSEPNKKLRLTPLLLRGWEAEGITRCCGGERVFADGQWRWDDDALTQGVKVWEVGGGWVGLRARRIWRGVGGVKIPPIQRGKNMV